MISISSASDSERMRLRSVLGHLLPDPFNASLSVFIAAAEQALRQYPNEWVIFIFLGGAYMRIGRYAAQLGCTKRLVELRPDDARSAYAHATSYNMLTRAGWTDANWQVMREYLQKSGAVPDIAIGPERAQEQLAEAGLTLEAAAGEAVYWFERALTLAADEPSRGQVREDLDTLYRRFPYLLTVTWRERARGAKQGDTEAVWHNFILHWHSANVHLFMVNTVYESCHLDFWSGNYRSELSRLWAETQPHYTLASSHLAVARLYLGTLVFSWPDKREGLGKLKDVLGLMDKYIKAGTEFTRTLASDEDFGSVLVRMRFRFRLKAFKRREAEIEATWEKGLSLLGRELERELGYTEFTDDEIEATEKAAARASPPVSRP